MPKYNVRIEIVAWVTVEAKNRWAAREAALGAPLEAAWESGDVDITVGETELVEELA